MWAALLSETSMFETPFLRFGDLMSFRLEAGVDDEAWLKAEHPESSAEDDDGQLSFL
jgi:hypothetical protein